MQFLLIHGTGGGPSECWYPWLSQILKQKGHEVVAPQFPTPLGQNLHNWLGAMEQYWKLFDDQLVLIGRSVGVPFALRLLERPPKKIKAAFLVAGFASDLGLPEFAPLIDSFIHDSFNWQRIKQNCEKFFIFHADNDPLVPLEKSEEIANKLSAKLHVVPNGEHLWFETLPEILPYIEAL